MSVAVQSLVFSCTFCCSSRIDMIKHSFGTHSMEPTFCGIGGCLHSFQFGSTFSSFKTHASRKHQNWQDVVNETRGVTPTPTLEVPSPAEMRASILDQCTNEGTVTEEVSHSETGPPTSTTSVNGTLHRRLSAKRSAALFLLTFQERYKLPQTPLL